MQHLIWAVTMALLIPVAGWADQDATSANAAETDKPAATITVGVETADADETTDDITAGHSNHGDAFNEGPRQAAYLMGDTGAVTFPITTASEQARNFFLQGLGQLHGFWYFEAERSFRQAAALDADCAMAYWGMAAANKGNEDRARGFLVEALNRLQSVTPREQLYVEALAALLGLPTKAEDLAKLADPKDFKPKRSDKDRRADYVKKLEDLIDEHPYDIEAKALLLVQLWDNTRHGLPMNSTLAADALAQQVLAENPMHPVHHYRIHIWDNRRAKTALESAAICGFTAPSIAHMWHMPGHIYSKQKRYADAAWHQEASARTDHRHMMNDHTLPDQIHNFAHNNEWLTRNLMNLGRIHDALDLAKNMTELPRHPKHNTLAKGGSAKYGRQRLFTILTRFEMWDAILELDKTTAYIEATDVNKEKLNRLRLLGRATFGSNDIDGGDVIIAELKALQIAVSKDEADTRKKAADEAAEKAAQDAEKNADKLDKQANETETETESAKNDDKQAPAKPKKSKDEKHGDMILNELMLARALAVGSSKAALADKEIKTGGVDEILLQHMYLASGDVEKVLAESKKEADRREGEVLPLALRVHFLYSADKREEAKQTFETLREISRDIDLDVPVFARLAAIADAFDMPQDWRLKRTPPDDIRKRPPLASLGPFRWRPSKAATWKLPDHNGKNVSLSGLTDKQAVLVIFYLGADCLHCVEQLNAFAPKVEAYEDAGIKIVAISLEDIKSLKASVSSYSDDGTFPFMLLSDDSLKVFKQYRAFDDFENMALHGTFLVDKRGYVRWQDISYDPFTKPDFLLDECKRLLAQPGDMVYGDNASVLRKLMFWKMLSRGGARAHQGRSVR
jgi:peroxiredoxin